MFQKYQEQNWTIIPVVPGSKKTAIAWKDGKVRPWTLDEFPPWEYNFALHCAASGLVAVDIDPAGALPWGQLCATHGEPSTLRARTGRGRHYVFKAKKGQAYRGQIQQGIDVRHNGIIVIEPSVHANGNPYKWENWGTEIAEVPGWLAALIEKRAKDKATQAGEVSALKLRKACEFLAGQTLPYGDWLTVGQALHASGVSDGLELWELVSRDREKNGQANTVSDCAKKWPTFDAEGPVQIASLFHLARSRGCVGLALAEDKVAFARDAATRREAEEAQEWHEGDNGIIYTVLPEQVVKKINAAGFAVFEPSGKILQVTREEGAIKPQFMEDKGFATLWAPYFLKRYDEEGEEKFIKAADFWRGHRERTSYSRIAFSPHSIDGALNLWGPIPCKKEPGDCSEILEFIETVVANGNKAKAEYLVQWCAQLVQRPATKSSVVPVLIGGQGSGKGLFTDGILAKILGPYYYSIDSTEKILARFNIDQTRRFLTVLDESTWGKNHAIANKLKHLSGSEVLQVEEKFGSTYNIENFSRYIITSNDIDCVRIDEGNRRYLVFETAEPREIEYYMDLWDKVREGSLIRKFYRYLMQVDLAGFHPQQFPKTLDTGAEATKVGSLSSVPRFLYELVFENPAQIWHLDTIGWYVWAKDLYALYSYRNPKPMTQIQFANEVIKAFPTLKEVWTLKGGTRLFRASPADVRAIIARRLRLSPDHWPADSEYTEDPVRYWF